MRLCFIKIHTYSSFNLLFSFSSSYRFLSFTEWHWTVKSVYLKMNYDVKLPVCWPQISSSMCVVKLVVQLFRCRWWVYKHNLCRLFRDFSQRSVFGYYYEVNWLFTTHLLRTAQSKHKTMALWIYCGGMCLLRLLECAGFDVIRRLEHNIFQVGSDRLSSKTSVILIH